MRLLLLLVALVSMVHLSTQGDPECLFGSWECWTACSMPCVPSTGAQPTRCRSRQIITLGHEPSTNEFGLRSNSEAEAEPDPPSEFGRFKRSSVPEVVYSVDNCYANNDTEHCTTVNSELSECPFDCTAGAWAGWSECSCDDHFEKDERNVSHTESIRYGNDQQCPDIDRYRCCTPDPSTCTTDCVMTHWSDWSGCERDCNSYRESRHRAVQTPAINGGKPCLDRYDSQPCKDCPCELEHVAWECKYQQYSAKITVGPCSKCYVSCPGHYGEGSIEMCDPGFIMVNKSSNCVNATEAIEQCMPTDPPPYTPYPTPPHTYPPYPTPPHTYPPYPTPPHTYPPYPTPPYTYPPGPYYPPYKPYTPYQPYPEPEVQPPVTQRPYPFPFPGPYGPAPLPYYPPYGGPPPPQSPSYPPYNPPVYPPASSPPQLNPSFCANRPDGFYPLDHANKCASQFYSCRSQKTVQKWCDRLLVFSPYSKTCVHHSSVQCPAPRVPFDKTFKTKKAKAV